MVSSRQGNWRDRNSIGSCAYQQNTRLVSKVRLCIGFVYCTQPWFILKDDEHLVEVRYKAGPYLVTPQPVLRHSSWNLACVDKLQHSGATSLSLGVFIVAGQRLQFRNIKRPNSSFAWFKVCRKWQQGMFRLIPRIWRWHPYACISSECHRYKSSLPAGLLSTTSF